MLVVNNFLKSILNLTKRTLLVLLVIYSCSCNNKTFVGENHTSISKLQGEAVQCVLEEYYRNTTKKIQNSAKLVILKKSFYFKTGLGISESLPVVRGKLQDTISMEAIPKIKFVKSVKMINSPVAKEQQGLERSFWRFSPLYSTQTEGFYILLSEKSNYEVKEVLVNLIRRKRNGSFEYLLPVNGYIVFD